jgi:hypothetical protein
VPNERGTYGAEFLARTAAGTGDSVGFGAVEAVARMQGTRHTQLFTFGLGPAWFGAPRAGLVTLDFTPMLGLERIDEKLIALTTLRGGGGFGLALERTEARREPLWSGPMNRGDFEEVTVDETALTLELVGGLDVPATRDAQFSAGLLVGIAWITQRYTEERPAMRPGTWNRIFVPGLRRVPTGIAP